MNQGRILSSIQSFAKTYNRNIMTTAVRRSHDEYTGTGSNLPFPIDNKYKLVLLFGLYFGSAFGYPFLAFHYQKIKQ